MKVKVKIIEKNCESCAYQGQQYYIPIGCTRCLGNCVNCGDKLKNYYPMKFYNKKCE